MWVTCCGSQTQGKTINLKTIVSRLTDDVFLPASHAPWANGVRFFGFAPPLDCCLTPSRSLCTETAAQLDATQHQLRRAKECRDGPQTCRCPAARGLFVFGSWVRAPAPRALAPEGLKCEVEVRKIVHTLPFRVFRHLSLSSESVARIAVWVWSPLEGSPFVNCCPKQGPRGSEGREPGQKPPPDVRRPWPQTQRERTTNNRQAANVRRPGTLTWSHCTLHI